MVNLLQVDLNLFVVFQAVLEEGSTVGAARRLSITQSAVSNALGRLRRIVGDPLFVRVGRGLATTPRAEQLRPVVRHALEGLVEALNPEFSPETTARTFTLACADHHQAADVPNVVGAFLKKMPHAELHVVSIDYLIATDGLTSGTVDAVLAPDGTKGPGLFATPLFREAAGLYVRRGHPALRRPQSLELLESLGHIDVHLTLGQPGTVNREVHDSLVDLGFRKRTAVVVPSFTTAAMIAQSTDLVAWLPEHAGRLFQRTADLSPLATPLPRWDVGCSLVWHERTDRDPGATYFRQLLLAHLGETKAQRSRRRPATKRTS